jgi:CheY-like chemotaxis protein
LLAGRKLLLADDSVTIQKVVDLTFVDEGVQVVAVSNGAEAIERLAEISPDVVLADVFMPGVTGYQVCEYIKQNEKLKHIPVMLLVGSFEPFDEAEARRVGADDILTKPFQSIRNLVDRVGGLLRGDSAADRFEKVSLNPPAAKAAEEGLSITEQEEVDTAKLPQAEVVEQQPNKMDPDELALTTADTQQLPPETPAHKPPAELEGDRAIEMYPHEEKLKTEIPLATKQTSAAPLDYGDVLLDLGDFEPVPRSVTDDAILEIDLDSPAPAIFSAARVQATVAVESQSEPVTVVDREAAWALQDQDTAEWEVVNETSAIETVKPAAVEKAAPAHEMVALEAPVIPEKLEQPEVAQEVSPHLEVEPAPATAPAPPVGQITLDQLSPEVIDAIARRAVEQLSEKVVEQIAWEVVPELAELLIKRQLEEKGSQTNR